MPNTDPAINVTGSTTPASSCTVPNGTIDITILPSGNYTFLWSNGASTEDIIGIPAGNYAVTATNIFGCSVTASYVIANDTAPPQILLYLYPPRCNGTPGWAEIQPIQGSFGPFEYSLNNGITFIPSDTVEGLDPGQYLLIIRDGNGCTTSKSISIPDQIYPIIFVEPEVNIKPGEQHQLHVSIGGILMDQIDTVIWVPSIGLTFEGNSITQLLNPIAQPTESLVYLVTVVSKDGCSAVAQINFRVSGDYHIYAPNVIWPEDPHGDNNTFYISTKPGSVREIRSLQIFDRWGNQVFLNQHFEPDNSDLGWKGDFRGQSMNPAVFVWWAELELFSGQLVIEKGDVTVVR